LRALARERLRNQRLTGAPAATPPEAVRWLGAVQAQERTIAKWSVGQRCADADERDVDRALADGAIVRTHVLRPTWHFVAADDLRWIVELTAPRVHSLSAYYYRKLEVDEKLAARSRKVFERALRDGPLTRPELAERLAAARIVADDLRLGYILMRAELDLVICGGPPRGKQRTYALVDMRVPPAPARDRDNALAELASRYFQSHGPATLKDFCWWSSLSVTEARRAVQAARALDRIEVEERAYWTGAAPATAKPARTAGAHLLQGYDELVIAYSESKDVFGGAPIPGTARWTTTPFLHAVTMDGRVVGTWRAVAKTRAVTVEMQLLRRPTDREGRALNAAVARYGAFLVKAADWRSVPATA
jgi:hypothetical protein